MSPSDEQPDRHPLIAAVRHKQHSPHPQTVGFTLAVTRPIQRLHCLFSLCQARPRPKYMYKSRTQKQSILYSSTISNQVTHTSSDCSSSKPPQHTHRTFSQHNHLQHTTIAPSHTSRSLVSHTPHKPCSNPPASPAFPHKQHPHPGPQQCHTETNPKHDHNPVSHLPLGLSLLVPTMPSKPSNWTSKHTAFVARLAKAGEDLNSIVILFETEFPDVKVGKGWIGEVVGSV